jgi:sodium/hydrogen antiporter
VVQEKLWFLIAGAIFVIMALSVTRLQRLPLTASILYLLVGVGIGPLGLGLLRLDALEQSAILLRIAEVAVIVSLFTAGLKLRLPLRSPRWRVPVALATASMVLGIALLSVSAYAVLGLPVGAALLLGAILAPTDPVLASDVQVEGPFDKDTVRLSLTAEAGLNDGAAFPFVLLGLALLGLHDLGTGGWRWIAIDLVWASAAGLGVGWILGSGIGRLVLYLRQRHQEAVGLDDFLALGLIALSYGAALSIHAYGFLAVFAAGVALRHVEMNRARGRTPGDDAASKSQAATDPRHAPAFLARAVLHFNEQLERIGEVVIVIAVGALLTEAATALHHLWLVPFLLVVARPVSVAPVLLLMRTSWLQRLLIGWFGIRGVGSIYYLMYAIERGLDPQLARDMIGITLSVVAASIVIHGLSATPLMRAYQEGGEAGA